MYLDHNAFVFEIVVAVARAIGRGEFRPAVERDRSGDFPRCRINGGGAVAVPIEGEDALGGRVIDNSVRTGIGFGFANNLERLIVEDGRRRGAAVAGESATELGRERDAVDAVRIGNV